ncbi:hypothetical protein SAMN05428642_103108 [Flaviramulus basaltis]|uniref:DUF6443 domain-containing protein n=1 Tax=Flaviramulus basaltis TaxID=369401 RepID=A0A1K2IMB3_9FLAO|nr:DUF6443 domain-containing protein [Flaviramulus basaltis]SFZ93394.1 hypothetical protein SAMN05428642_103108 [Flaviramulus basaltis]
MKKLLFTLAAIFVTSIVKGQVTATENYIKSTTFQVETQDGITNANTQTSLLDEERIQAITYFDGLGRPKQNIDVRSGGNNTDIITHMEYDEFGRQVKYYLPIERQSGTSESFHAINIFSDINSYYQNKHPNDFIGLNTEEVNAYSESVYEASPLNRVIEQTAPGKDWSKNVHTYFTIDESWPYIDFISQTSGYTSGNPVDFSIDENGLMSCSLSFGGAGNGIKLQLGDVKFLSNNIPDTDLGYIYDAFFHVTTSYHVTIQNGFLHIDSPNQEFVKGASAAFTHQFDFSDQEVVYGGHTIKFEYGTNVETDYVRRFGVSFVNGNTEEPQLVDNDLYAPNELYKTITKDENWQPNQSKPNDHTTEEYKDKQGRVILKRTFDAGKWHDTYYVYDDFGNLTYVLPPKVTTYQDITQNWLVKTYDFFDVSGLFAQQTDYNEISFYFSPNGVLNFYIYAEAEEIELADGLVMNLDFISPSLPNIDLGDMFFSNSNNLAGDAYIQNGNLYFNSEGSIDYGDTEFDFSIYLSNYQNIFTPPVITQSQLDELAYQYKYDSRNRLIEKKLPGKGWEHIVYNKLDQPVLTQDTNLRSQNEWLFTKYDAFGRIAYTGKLSEADLRPAAQLYANGITNQFEERTVTPNFLNGTYVYYTHGAYPEDDGSYEILTIAYYDDYIDLPTGLNPTITTYYGLTSSTNTKSLSTISKVRVLGTADWITTVTYYDDKGRPIYTYSENEYLDTIDIVESQLDFTGKVLETKTTHKKTGQTDIVTIDTYEYDHVGRLISQKQNINNQGEELIAKNHYDELGQLVKKDVGNTEAQPLQEIDYTYNIRGWLKTINDPTNLHQDNDLFSFGLNYNKPEGPSTSSTYNTPLYNGNISHTYWKTDNIDGGLRHYSYRYDALNRFKNAYFAENHTYNNKFNEYIYNYDRNGNIGRIFRFGLNPTNSQYSYPMDNITYTYDGGNKLMGVQDSYGTNTTSNSMGGFKDGNTVGYDYSYDDNGNMLIDRNKGIITQIKYNHLNLPYKIVFNGNDPLFGNTAEVIEYYYTADGVKLKKVVKTGTTPGSKNNARKNVETIYSGNFVYHNLDNGNGEQLEFFNHPEGYVEPKNENDLSQGFDYIYQYKDHLGNIRLSYKDSNHDGVVTGASEQIFVDDFEDSVEGVDWNGTGNSWGWDVDEFDSNFKFKGNKSARLDPHPTVHHENVAHSNDWITISNTQTTDYIYSAWVYLENVSGNQADIFLFMNEPNETGYYTLIDSQTTSTKGVWVYLEKKVSVPPNISELNIRIDNNYSGSVWFDNVSIRKANDPNDIEIVEENNYYPFGLKHKGYNDNPSAFANPALKWKYNDVEFEEVLGLNLYEMDVRMYDPAIARFNGIDPVTHFSQGTSVGFDNNPIYWADPSGADSINGETIGADGLTNSQWMELSRPGGGGFDAMRQQAFANSTFLAEQRRNVSVITGDLQDGCVDCSLCPETCMETIRSRYAQVDMEGTQENLLAMVWAIGKIDGSFKYADYAGALIVLEALGLVGMMNQALIFTQDHIYVQYLYNSYYAKQEKEIQRILSKEGGPPGFMYSLIVNHDTTTMDVRGNIVHLNAGDVWKYGETTNGFKRYSDGELRTMVPGGVTMVPMFFGNTVQIKIQEKIMIYGHYLATGSLPPGNKIFR